MQQGTVTSAERPPGPVARVGHARGCGWRVVLARLALLLGFAAPLPAAAAPPMYFTHMGVGQGLSQSWVNAIAQDQQGYLWIGTQDGLNRYDGLRVEVFNQVGAEGHRLWQSDVQALASDDRGRMWIGTMGGGLAVHDPDTGQIQRTAALNGQPLIPEKDEIYTLLVDQHQRLWVGTAHDGLYRIDLKTGERTHYTPAPAGTPGLVSATVCGLGERSAGGAWIGTDQGLQYVDPDHGVTVPVNAEAGPDQPPLPVKTSYRHLLETAGDLWIGTSTAGLLRLHLATGGVTAFVHGDDDPESLPANLVTGLWSDSAGRLWISTNNGLAHWRETSGDRFYVYRHDPNDAASLPDSQVGSIFEDRSGLLWVATSNAGVSRWNPRSWSFGLIPADQLLVGAKPGADFSALAEDADGNLWIGLYGGGLRRRAPDGTVTSFSADPSRPDALPSEITLAMTSDRAGTVWVATKGGLCGWDPRALRCTTRARLDEGRGWHDNAIIGMSEGHDDRLWLATFGNGLASFNRRTHEFVRYRYDANDPTSLPSDILFNVWEDPAGYVWVVTNAAGLAVLDPRTGRFHRFAHDERDPRSVPSDTIMAIHQDVTGTVWLGSRDGGLTRVSGSPAQPETMHFDSFGVDRGLANGTIWCLESDTNGRIWLATSAGLAVFDPRRQVFRTFHRGSGLQGEEYNHGLSLRRRDGRLVFGGHGGLNEFRPDKLEWNTRVPPVLVTRIEKNGRALDLGRRDRTTPAIEMSFRDSMLGLDVAALDFADPTRNSYVYRLEGYDRDWITARPGQKITYSSLPGGHFTLHIRAANSDGTWNEEGVRIPVLVHPAPWDTWQAKVSMLLLLAAVIGYLSTANERKLRRQREYSARLEADVAARTEELSAANTQLREASLTDPLTGLGNRRYLAEAITGLLATAPAGSPLQYAAMIVDLDYLKPINDTYGHEAGDKLILQIADILRRCCRGSDYVARWGGDEFVVVYLGADARAAATLAENIRSRVAKQVFRVAPDVPARSSCSIGFACRPFVPGAAPTLDWEQTLLLADTALNLAKKNRNDWAGLVPAANSDDDVALREVVEQLPDKVLASGLVVVERREQVENEAGLAEERLVGRRSRDPMP